jgi:hypothetical protein
MNRQKHDGVALLFGLPRAVPDNQSVNVLGRRHGDRRKELTFIKLKGLWNTRSRLGVSRRLGDFVIHVCGVGVVVTIKGPVRNKIEVPPEQSITLRRVYAACKYPG